MSHSDLVQRVAEVRGRIAEAQARGGHTHPVTIVAVTKTFGADTVVAAYEAGLTDVGENKVQEALGKMGAVTVPAKWHLVGHLQRNKVKDTRDFALIHSLDNKRLAVALDRFAAAGERVIDVLLQVNASGEASKGGFAPAEVGAAGTTLAALRGLRVRGVMALAELGVTEAELRRTFERARGARAVLAAAGHPATELSIGMSQDYEVAVEEGATMVRLGTTLFGARD